MRNDHILHVMIDDHMKAQKCETSAAL